jgi:transcriptional regulator with XRE-family HTH domain/tetratricopeptide (TPR) repeat protein
MANEKLRAARLQKHWSQVKAAEKAGISVLTYSRWEKGVQTPYLTTLDQLCEAFEMSPAALGLGHIDGSDPAQIVSVAQTSSVLIDRQGREISHESDTDELLLPKELESLCTDLEFRVQCIIYEVLSQRPSLQRLRKELTSILTVEGNVTMDIERRKLLRHLALIPIQTFGLTAFGASRSFLPEDILIHCAAGITACEHLSRGIDLNLAYSATCAYVPTLKSIAKDCPSQRREAIELISQAMLLLTTLGLHLEGSKAAINYAQQAVNYSEISGSLELILTSLGQLAWIFSCDKQYHKALEKVQLAEHLLTNAKQSVHPLVRSNTYAVLGAYSAQNGHREYALKALDMATQTFFSTPPMNEFNYMDYDYSEVALTWGLAHARTGYPEEALKAFTEIIDPTMLTVKMPVSERVRVEFLNHMALASVKSSIKDMEQAVTYWQAGIQGAKALKSEQRFSEAMTAYEIMESVWHGDKRITNLRELIVHW